MKKLLMSAFLLLAVVAVKAQGQGGGQGAQGGGGQRQMLPPAERAKAMFSNERFAAFAFTEDQKTKMTDVLVKFYASSDSLLATIPQDGDRMAAMQALAPKRVAMAGPTERALVAMLTAEQKKTYDAALAAVKERNPNATSVFLGGGGRPRN